MGDIFHGVHPTIRQDVPPWIQQAPAISMGPPGIPQPQSARREPDLSQVLSHGEYPTQIGYVNAGVSHWSLMIIHWEYELT